MKNRVLSHVLLVLSVLFGAAIAQAGTITLTGPTSVTITEDGVVHDFFFTLTNDSGSTITKLNFDLSSRTGGKNISGDFTDLPNPFEISFFGGLIAGSTCVVNSSMADGQSCVVGIGLHAADGTGETDNDSASANFVFGVTYLLASGDSTFTDATLHAVETDPAVPEPSSFVLAVGGLAGLGMRRRRRVQSRRSKTRG